MAKEGLFYAFLLWREKHIKEKHFILIISFLVGICTATSALLLKTLIHFFQHLLTGNFNVDEANYLYLLYPVVGILLAGLFVKYIVRDDISHGVGSFPVISPQITSPWQRGKDNHRNYLLHSHRFSDR